jgi:HlyD family secretion protein
MIAKTGSKTNIADILGLNGSPGRSPKKKRLIVGLLLGALLVLALILLAPHGSRIEYKIQEIQRGSLTVKVTATGTLQPTNTVSVGSELSGIVKRVDVDYNDHVKPGQILARLDTSKLEAQITQYKAALESAKGKVSQTEATVKETQAKLAQYRKVRELSKGKVPSQAEMDSAEASFERAKADAVSAAAAVSQAEATIEANETDLAKSIIRSPIKGIVLSRSIDPGQTVAASFQAPTLFTVAEDLTRMELQVNVDEADIGKVRKGQKATFSVSSYPNRIFEGQITKARYGSTTSTSGVVTYVTELKVNNPDMLLRPGMTATADITVNEIKDAVLVPSAALRFTPEGQEKEPSSGGSLISKLLPRPPRGSSKPNGTEASAKKQQLVWILRDGKPASIGVTTGETNGVMTEVVSGDIKPGMQVIVDTAAKKP